MECLEREEKKEWERERERVRIGKGVRIRGRKKEWKKEEKSGEVRRFSRRRGKKKRIMNNARVKAGWNNCWASPYSWNYIIRFSAKLKHYIFHALRSLTMATYLLSLDIMLLKSFPPWADEKRRLIRSYDETAILPLWEPSRISLRKKLRFRSTT